MGLISWLKGAFSSLLRAFKSFISAVFDTALKVLIAEFKDFAISVVQDLANSDLTNDEKRAEAFKRIKDEAINRGKNLSDSVVNLLIELVVQYLKGERKL